MYVDIWKAPGPPPVHSGSLGSHTRPKLAGPPARPRPLRSSGCGDRSDRAPHLAQLLVDELLQLRGFLRRQRHAGAGASRPLVAHLTRCSGGARRPGRAASAAGGAQSAASASDLAGRESGSRGAPTNLTVFKRCGTDRRRGWPVSRLIDAVHRSASSSSRIDVLRRQSSTYAPRERRPPRAPASFCPEHRQRAGRLQDPKDPKDPGRSRVAPSVPRRWPRYPGGRSSCSHTHCSHVRSLRGVGPRPNELYTPDGESLLELTRSPPRPGKRHLALGEPGTCFCFKLLACKQTNLEVIPRSGCPISIFVSPIKACLLAETFVACDL